MDLFWDNQVDEVGTAMTALAEAVSRAEDMEQVLLVVCEQVVHVVPGADLASVTVLDGGHTRTAVSTDERAVTIDGEQYQQDDGPCLRAARSGEIVRVDIATAERLWPEFSATARRLGVGSYLAAPLPLGADGTGALNLFGFGAHGFRDVEERLLDLYTSLVTAVIRAMRRYLDVKESVRQVTDAIPSRAVIEQAKGIIMAVNRVDADEAFRLLVERSQRENRKLRDVAAEFVASASVGER